MSVKVENFGCRLNALEGDSVKALAEAGLLTPPSSMAAP